MRRWLIRIVLLLVIGAMVNVAVAWGLAVRPDPFSNCYTHWTATISEQKHGPSGDFEVYRCVRTLAVTLGEAEICESSALYRPFGDTALSPREFADRVPTWSQLHRRQPSLDHENTTWFVEWAAGWPCLALRAESWLSRMVASDDITVAQAGVIRIPEAWKSAARLETMDLRQLRGRNAFPLIPIWPGFCVNTLLYACATWLVFVAPLAALRYTKRARRLRRGLCLRCGYDLRGATSGGACPECGALSEPRLQRSGA